MNEKKSASVLRALVSGVNPVTGEQLAPDSVINNADVMRALLHGVTALDAIGARSLRRASLPENVGKGWTDEEEAKLREEFAEEQSVEELAKVHGRTVRAISARLEKMGLIPAGSTSNLLIPGAAEDPPKGRRRRARKYR